MGVLFGGGARRAKGGGQPGRGCKPTWGYMAVWQGHVSLGREGPGEGEESACAMLKGQMWMGSLGVDPAWAASW